MQALILEQQDGKTLASVQAVEESRLPEGEVTVDIDWSSLNYKDALAITGKGKIIRNFPMVPGSISLAGFIPAKIRASIRPACAAHRLGRG
jgi:acrylyl-CoA reductase (NADPH)